MRVSLSPKSIIISIKARSYGQSLPSFWFGLLLPLSFAPFHLPGLAILSLAFFYAQLVNKDCRFAFLNGLFFGLGYFGLGTSWIFISIRDYGHLNSYLAALITLSFLLYLSLFPAVMAFIFKKFAGWHFSFSNCLLFSALWILFEFLRANLFGGFPWILVGFSQFDAPSKYLLPIIGVFGVSFVTCLAATLLASSGQLQGKKYYLRLSCFVLLVIAPLLLKPINWAKEKSTPLSVGIIQANLSMRDKWDEELFWQLITRYQQQTEALLGTSLIVMPESAIPLPAAYLEDLLSQLDDKAKQANSAVLLGIPQAGAANKEDYFNALISLGRAKGYYLKQHLVPFGEYIPELFSSLSKWLNIPDAHLKPGEENQTLVRVKQHPIATLICYEVAYSELLRRQLPQGEWIVSISDDGWFGHSLAMYQQQQMAQVRSMETARYQVVANNDGLSSLINTRGKIIASLPPFSAGLLKTELFPATGQTPWVYWGDLPSFLFCLLIVLFIISHSRAKSISGP